MYNSTFVDKWYKQIILLSEALPLSQAKQYSSIAQKVNKNVVNPIWPPYFDINKYQ